MEKKPDLNLSKYKS